MSLSMAEKIRILLRRKKMTITDLADILDTSRQNLNNKLNRDNFTEKELQQIAKVLQCDFEGFFIFEDGSKI